jgi:hypothetical protein
MAYVLHTLTPDDFFVDVGANVGSYTVLACAVRGAKGYCFEPVPTTYRRLLDNLRLNDLTSRVVSLNSSRYGFNEAEIIKNLEDRGFAPYSYHPFIRELRPLAGKNNQAGNTLFIKDLDFVRERLANTPRVQVGSFDL